MASALDLMKDGIFDRMPTSPTAALSMMAVDTLVGFGTSFALAEVYTRYADKAWGRHAPSIVAGVGKAIEGLLLAFWGPGWASGLAGAIGQAGVNGLGMELGFAHARKAAGIQLVKVPAGTDVRRLKRGDAVPGATALGTSAVEVGALPPAVAGRAAAWDQISELRAMH